MDPQTTLYDLLDAMARNDRIAVANHLESLAEWNRNGGFMPTVDRPDAQSVAHFIVRRKVSENEAGPLHDVVQPAPASNDNAFSTEPQGERMTVSPGDHLLLPENWVDDDWSGKLTAEAVVQGWDQFSERFIVTPLEESYEKTLPPNNVHWGRVAWMNASDYFGSGMQGVEDVEEPGSEFDEYA